MNNKLRNNPIALWKLKSNLILHFLAILISLGLRGVLQENYKQIDAPENDNQPPIIVNPNKETTEAKKDSIKMNREENNDREISDEEESENDEGKFDS